MTPAAIVTAIAGVLAVAALAALAFVGLMLWAVCEQDRMGGDDEDGC